MNKKINFITIDNVGKDFEVCAWFLFFSKGRWVVSVQVNKEDSDMKCFVLSRQEYNRLWDLKIKESQEDKCSFCNGKGYKVNQYCCPSCGGSGQKNTE